MESLTKRILAIVLVAVIGVGIGVGAWIFLLAPGAGEYKWSADDCPGAPTDISADQIIRVGVIGDTERIQGEGAENGAWLAAKQINTAGGITVGNTTYYLGITSENTDEANPLLDTSVAVRAAKRLINYKKIQFVTGGFRSEAMGAYQLLFMEEEIIFWNTGAAPSSWCQYVIDDYDTYKYFFQPSPLNTTALAIQLITHIIYTSIIYSNNPLIFNHSLTRFSYIREDYEWTETFEAAMTPALQNNDYINLTFTGTSIAAPPDSTPAQMATYLSRIRGNNTQILIPIFSGPVGTTFATAYYDDETPCVPIGINVVAQDSEFWSITNGKCEYGITMESVFETNKTSLTLAFWSAYETEFGHSPIYTAVGSYDAIYQLAWAIETAQSLDNDILVTTLEGITKANPRLGAGGNGAYWPNSHGPVYGWPYGTGLMIQWYDGSKRLIPGPGQYPSGLGIMVPPSYGLQNMDPFRLPDWGIYFYD